MEITWKTGVLSRILLLLSHLAGVCLSMPHVLRFGEPPFIDLLLTCESNFDRVCVRVHARARVLLSPSLSRAQGEIRADQTCWSSPNLLLCSQSERACARVCECARVSLSARAMLYMLHDMP